MTFSDIEAYLLVLKQAHRSIILNFVGWSVNNLLPELTKWIRISRSRSRSNSNSNRSSNSSLHAESPTKSSGMHSLVSAYGTYHLVGVLVSFCS